MTIILISKQRTGCGSNQMRPVSCKLKDVTKKLEKLTQRQKQHHAHTHVQPVWYDLAPHLSTQNKTENKLMSKAMQKYTKL